MPEYPLHQFILLGRLEITLSNPNNNVKILTQAYCISIVSLSLLKLGIAQDEIRKVLLIKQRTE